MKPLAILIAVLGLGPYVGFGLGALSQNPGAAVRMLDALIQWGALVLAFGGAVHWGLALAPSDLPRRPRPLWLVAALVPMLLGWAALNLQAWLALVVLIVGLLLTAAGEREVSRRDLLPTGYVLLRYGFTVVAVAMLVTVLTLRLLGQTIVF
jgi:hypothetical protein